MDHGTSYIPLDMRGAGKREQSFFWILNAVLRCRQSIGLPTGSRRPDEDVNMYLSNLLCRYAENPADLWLGAEIVPWDIELRERLEDCGEDRTKYQAYRCNADHILVTLGIFDNAWWRSPGQADFYAVPGRRQIIGRASSYYSMAATYATRLHEGRRGLDRIMDKLGEGFSEYLCIMEGVRSEYFHMTRSFSSGEWYHLCRNLGLASGDS